MKEILSKTELNSAALNKTKRNEMKRNKMIRNQTSFAKPQNRLGPDFCLAKWEGESRVPGVQILRK